MSYDVTISSVERLHLAAVHDHATLRELPDTIRQHVGTVLQVLGKSQTTFGRCVVIYWDDGQSPLSPETAVPLHVGWEVDDPVTDEDSGVVSVSTPAGMVATAVHIGPYDRIGEAHQAIRAWCAERHRSTSTNWEVYDHPRPDQPPRTDVFYLIQ